MEGEADYSPDVMLGPEALALTYVRRSEAARLLNLQAYIHSQPRANQSMQLLLDTVVLVLQPGAADNGQAGMRLRRVVSSSISISDPNPSSSHAGTAQKQQPWLQLEDGSLVPLDQTSDLPLQDHECRHLHAALCEHAWCEHACHEPRVHLNSLKQVQVQNTAHYLRVYWQALDGPAQALMQRGLSPDAETMARASMVAVLRQPVSSELEQCVQTLPLRTDPLFMGAVRFWERRLRRLEELSRAAQGSMPVGAGQQGTVQPRDGQSGAGAGVAAAQEGAPSHPSSRAKASGQMQQPGMATEGQAAQHQQPEHGAPVATASPGRAVPAGKRKRSWSPPAADGSSPPRRSKQPGKEEDPGAGKGKEQGRRESGRGGLRQEERGKHRSEERERDRDREREGDRDRDREREGEGDRSRDKERGRGRGRDEGRASGKELQREPGRSRERGRDRSRERDASRHQGPGKDRERGRERSSEERRGSSHRERSRSRSPAPRNSRDHGLPLPTADEEALLAELQGLSKSSDPQPLRQRLQELARAALAPAEPASSADPGATLYQDVVVALVGMYKHEGREVTSPKRELLPHLYGELWRTSLLPQDVLRGLTDKFGWLPALLAQQQPKGQRIVTFVEGRPPRIYLSVRELVEAYCRKLGGSSSQQGGPAAGGTEPAADSRSGHAPPPPVGGSAASPADGAGARQHQHQSTDQEAPLQAAAAAAAGDDGDAEARLLVELQGLADQPDPQPLRQRLQELVRIAYGKGSAGRTNEVALYGGVAEALASLYEYEPGDVVKGRCVQVEPVKAALDDMVRGWDLPWDEYQRVMRRSVWLLELVRRQQQEGVVTYQEWPFEMCLSVRALVAAYCRRHGRRQRSSSRGPAPEPGQEGGGPTPGARRSGGGGGDRGRGGDRDRERGKSGGAEEQRGSGQRSRSPLAKSSRDDGQPATGSDEELLFEELQALAAGHGPAKLRQRLQELAKVALAPPVPATAPDPGSTLYHEVVVALVGLYTHKEGDVAAAEPVSVPHLYGELWKRSSSRSSQVHPSELKKMKKQFGWLQELLPQQQPADQRLVTVIGGRPHRTFLSVPELVAAYCRKLRSSSQQAAPAAAAGAGSTPGGNSRSGRTPSPTPAAAAAAAGGDVDAEARLLAELQGLSASSDPQPLRQRLQELVHAVYRKGIPCHSMEAALYASVAEALALLYEHKAGDVAKGLRKPLPLVRGKVNAVVEGWGLQWGDYNARTNSQTWVQDLVRVQGADGVVTCRPDSPWFSSFSVEALVAAFCRPQHSHSDGPSQGPGPGPGPDGGGGAPPPGGGGARGWGPDGGRGGDRRWEDDGRSPRGRRSRSRSRSPARGQGRGSRGGGGPRASADPSTPGSAGAHGSGGSSPQQQHHHHHHDQQGPGQGRHYHQHDQQRQYEGGPGQLLAQLQAMAANVHTEGFSGIRSMLEDLAAYIFRAPSTEEERVFRVVVLALIRLYRLKGTDVTEAHFVSMTALLPEVQTASGMGDTAFRRLTQGADWLVRVTESVGMKERRVIRVKPPGGPHGDGLGGASLNLRTLLDVYCQARGWPATGSGGDGGPRHGSGGGGHGQKQQQQQQVGQEEEWEAQAWLQQHMQQRGEDGVGAGEAAGQGQGQGQEAWAQQQQNGTWQQEGHALPPPPPAPSLDLVLPPHLSLPGELQGHAQPYSPRGAPSPLRSAVGDAREPADAGYGRGLGDAAACDAGGREIQGSGSAAWQGAAWPQPAVGAGGAGLGQEARCGAAADGPGTWEGAAAGPDAAGGSCFPEEEVLLAELRGRVNDGSINRRLLELAEAVYPPSGSGRVRPEHAVYGDLVRVAAKYWQPAGDGSSSSSDPLESRPLTHGFLQHNARLLTSLTGNAFSRVFADPDWPRQLTEQRAREGLSCELCFLQGSYSDGDGQPGRRNMQLYVPSLVQEFCRLVHGGGVSCRQ